MKIGITCYPTYGGSGAVATELGIALAERGHQVHFICYRLPFRLNRPLPNIFFREVEVAEYPLFDYPPYGLALASMMAEAAEVETLDLLHVHYAIPHATSAILARQMLAPRRKLPVLTTLHGTDVTVVGAMPVYLPITRWSIDQSDGVSIVSNYLEQQTREVFGTQRDLRVIPNFIDPVVYSRREVEPLRHELGLVGRKVLMHVSNFRPVKRIRDAVEVFDRLRKRFPSKLVLVGDGPERVKVEHLCRERGLCPDVMFLGKRDDLPELLSLADLYLLPSDLESFGLSALEAQACGVPVLGTRGGLAEVVEQGRTGFCFDVGDVDGMAEAGAELLGDPTRWQAFSEASRERAITLFPRDKVVEQYERFYRETIERVG